MSKHRRLSGPCHRCGRGGHFARDCSIRFRCNGCGRRGHISKFCNDPFIKAEEVEKRNRQQAFLQARSASGKSGASCVGKSASPLSTAIAATNTTTHLRGPWDGLGERKDTSREGKSCIGYKLFVSKLDLAGSLQDQKAVDIFHMHTKSSNIRGKTGSTREKTGTISDKVKILTVKRKINLTEQRGRVNRRPAEVGLAPEEDLRKGSTSDSPCEISTKDCKEPVQWKGLIGYGSENSWDDRSCSDSVDSGLEDSKSSQRTEGSDIKVTQRITENSKELIAYDSDNSRDDRS